MLKNDWKSKIGGMAAAAVMLMLTSATANAQRYGNNAPLVGTWVVAVNPINMPSFTAYNVFSADGNSTEFDNSNPPSQQTIAVGPWVRTGPLDYTFVEVNQLFDAKGNFAGTLKVSAVIKMDASEDKFTSTFTFTVYDPKGNNVFQGTGNSSGQRVTVD